jgi:hypothetical protein
METPMTRRLVEENALSMTGNLFLTADADITSEAPNIVAAGERRLKEGVGIIRDQGSDL